MLEWFLSQKILKFTENTDNAHKNRLILLKYFANILILLTLSFHVKTYKNSFC